MEKGSYLMPTTYSLQIHAAQEIQNCQTATVRDDRVTRCVYYKQKAMPCDGEANLGKADGDPSSDGVGWFQNSLKPWHPLDDTNKTRKC